MAPTTTIKRTAPKTQNRKAHEDGHTELAQQFKTVKDYTAYVLARMQQANPEGPIQSSTPDIDPDETETEVRPRKEKRVKGRRRAANPVATIEASLRRQSELKSNFRNLARPLKNVLDEMGRRTTESLESDAHAHEQATEHTRVKAGLESALHKRSTAIERGNDFQRGQLDSRLQAEEQMIRSRYEQTVNDTQDRFLDDFDHRILQIERQSRMAEAAADHDTDDEDDVLLQPHHMSYRYDRGSALPTEYDSRSRLNLAVDEAHGQLGARNSMQDMLQDQEFSYNPGHTIMDSSIRDAAEARREGMAGVDLLSRATQQVETEAQKKRPKPATIFENEAHTTLMELADAATRPRNTRSAMPPPETPVRRPLTATRAEQDDVFSMHSSVPGATLNSRKRSRSGTHILNSPFVHNPMHELSASRDTSTAHDGTEIKEEHRISPASQSGSRTTLPLQLPVDALHTNEIHPLPPRPPFDTLYGNRFERHPSILSRASLDRRSFATKDDALSRYWGERGRIDDVPPQLSPRLSVLPPASPFSASPMFAHTSRPPSDYDAHLRHMDFNHRPLLQQPPAPPTAQPVNHFANSGAHRNSFSSAPFAAHHAPSSWSSMSPTPLVALPQGETPRLQPLLPPLSVPPFAPFGQQHNMPVAHGLPAPLPPPPAPAAPPNQYGGPTLAPAADPSHAPQPAFAQQMGRNDQGRRRNTEGAFPRFREYRGPS